MYFGFSASETNGLLVFVPLLLFILALPTILKYTSRAQANIDRLEDEKLLLSWMKESKARLSHQKNIARTVEPFDPNTLSKAAWVAMGFDEYMAQRICNYIQKGGRFKSAKDLYKIYGIDKKLVDQYVNRVHIKNQASSHVSKPWIDPKVQPKRVEKKPLVKLDLNVVDESQLQVVRGIGPVLSERIVKYRAALGGFLDADQLREVYGLDEVVARRVLSQFEIKTSNLQKVNINQDSIRVLYKHPYISYKTALAIVKYRQQHGDYPSVEAIKNIHSIPDSVYQKMAPYLKIDALE